MELENSMAVSSAYGEASVSSSSQQPAAAVGPPMKKRSLPGMPDANAEVIALSPKTLMATNRFFCEICNKGFQREQNLQLHRRGHNLPWKLRQRPGKEIRKRVYVCPETSCLHHDPLRALGDLTGIKKHFCRKHGVKKWKCDKCSKKYAVLSDWKAHSKICGTREYRCDCGTLFSRRDSFITHRAFCTALAEENTKTQTVENSTSGEDPKLKKSADSATYSSPPTVVISEVLPIQHREPKNQTEILPLPSPVTVIGSSSSSSSIGSSSSNNLFSSIFASASASNGLHSSVFSVIINAMTHSERGTAQQTTAEPTSLSLSSNPSTLFSPLSTTTLAQDRRQFTPPLPHMSATALLQKAAEMGAAASNASLLCGFGLSSSTTTRESEITSTQSSENGVGLGLSELMMDQSSLFGIKPTTLDFLGLGMGSGAGAAGGFSALISSIGSGLDVGKSWEGPERKPNNPALM